MLLWKAKVLPVSTHAGLHSWIQDIFSTIKEHYCHINFLRKSNLKLVIEEKN